MVSVLDNALDSLEQNDKVLTFDSAWKMLLYNSILTTAWSVCCSRTVPRTETNNSSLCNPSYYKHAFLRGIQVLLSVCMWCMWIDATVATSVGGFISIGINPVNRKWSQNVLERFSNQRFLYILLVTLVECSFKVIWARILKDSKNPFRELLI